MLAFIKKRYNYEVNPHIQLIAPRRAETLNRSPRRLVLLAGFILTILTFENVWFFQMLLMSSRIRNPCTDHLKFVKL